jgi:fibronectin type 3 domain-containing protein
MKKIWFLVLLLSVSAAFAQAEKPRIQPAQSVTAESSATDITISWKLPKQNGVRRVQLFRKSADLPMNWDRQKSGLPSTVDLGEKLVNLKPAQTSYQDKIVEAGKRYYYRVLLLDTKNKASEPSLPAIASLKDTVAPAPVTLDKASAIDDETLLLSWKASDSNDVEAYRIYRMREGSSATVIKIVNLDKARQKHYEIRVKQKKDAQITYDYAVSAVDMAGNESASSNRIKLRLPDSVAPQMPLQLTLKQLNEQVQINWLASSEDDLAGYRVYRKLVADNSEFQALHKDLIRDATFIDTGVQQFTQYRYRVAAVDRYGNESNTSKGLLLRTTGFDAPVMAPQNLKVTSDKKGFPLLKWQLKQDKGIKLAGVIIQRSDGGPFKQISDIKNQIQFTDQSVVAGRTYKYQLQVLSTGGELSPVSNTVMWTGVKK